MSTTARGAAEGPPEPRSNPELIGHESAERTLLQAWQTGRMPHAWLIEGPAGIGKATLAYRFARFVLAERRAEPPDAVFAAVPSISPAGGIALPEDDATFRLVAVNSHPDLLVVERQYDEKRN